MIKETKVGGPLRSFTKAKKKEGQEWLTTHCEVEGDVVCTTYLYIYACVFTFKNRC